MWYSNSIVRIIVIMWNIIMIKALANYGYAKQRKIHIYNLKPAL